MINSRKSNIIVGCPYKHPNMDVSEFNKNYLNTLLDKLYKENKYLLDYFDKIWSDVLQLDQQDVNLSIESF